MSVGFKTESDKGYTLLHFQRERSGYQSVRKMSATPPLVAGRSLVYAFSISRDFQSAFRTHYAASPVIVSIAWTSASTPPTSLETTVRTPQAHFSSPDQAICRSCLGQGQDRTAVRILHGCQLHIQQALPTHQPFLKRPEAMPLPRSPACPLSRTPLEANRPTRDPLSFRAARKVHRRVAESAAQSGSGRSARLTSVRMLMASSRSRPDGDLPFCPVVHSGAAICRLWCVSLPHPQLDTNLMPKRGFRLHRFQRQAFLIATAQHGPATFLAKHLSVGSHPAQNTDRVHGW
jgi:hypothetical protein